jgi:hypothetical protein
VEDKRVRTILEPQALKEHLPTVPTLHTFFDILKHHDWYFEMSDDHRVWKAGATHEEQIKSMCRISEPHKTMHKAFTDHIFEGKKVPVLDDFISL